MAATLDDVAEIALRLPGTAEVEGRMGRAWAVGSTTFAWERPFSKADVRRFGDAPVPPLPVLAVRVDDLGEKEAVLGAGHRGVFTIPHFDGYAAVLLELRLAGKRVLRQLLEDGWAACAPPDLLAERRPARRRTPRSG
jgi:hypothetical protein